MARVLIVDDEPSIRTTLRQFLLADGYEVEVAEHADEALASVAAATPDVVVTDIVLPRIDGVDLMKRIRKAAPGVRIIMMTGEPTVETASDALRGGATDYLMKPVGKDVILRSVRQAVEIKALDDERRRLERVNRQNQKDLQRRVDEQTAKLRATNERLQRAMEQTVQAMALTVESRDPYTAGHQQHVATLALAIARELHLPEDQTKGLYLGGLIHDLGKISVPAEILSKPSRLTEPEFALIRVHPQSGFEILQTIEFPWPIAEIVRQHHERMNGSGYPRGLDGQAICREARILAVADVVEAMASHRPYRPALGIDAALAEIEQKRDVLYDGEAVQACIRLFHERGFAFGSPRGTGSYTTDPNVA